jgi:hypothetical protein
MAPCRLEEMVTAIFRERVFQEGPFKPWWWWEQVHGRASNCFTIYIFDKYVHFPKIYYSISKVYTKWILYCFYPKSYRDFLASIDFWKLEVRIACDLTTYLEDRTLFRRVRKIGKTDISFVMNLSLCPTVRRLSAWNNWASTGRIFMKFDI